MQVIAPPIYICVNIERKSGISCARGLRQHRGRDGLRSKQECSEPIHHSTRHATNWTEPRNRPEQPGSDHAGFRWMPPVPAEAAVIESEHVVASGVQRLQLPAHTAMDRAATRGTEEDPVGRRALGGERQRVERHAITRRLCVEQNGPRRTSV